jgi:hypothetical protein
MSLVNHKLENINVTYQGDHTGLGVIDFGQVQIVSMGPHYFPLGEPSRFGIYRKGDDFSDIETSLHKISGWTKFIPCDRSFGSGATWIYFAAEKKENEVHVSALFENGKGEDPFAFVFFVKADEIQVFDKRYQKGTLSGYQGMSGPMQLINKEKKVFMQSEVKAPMHITPLAGGEFFWGADFLIAYEIHDLHIKYDWSFRESI